MNQLAHSRYLVHLLVLALVIVLAAAAMLVAHVGMAVLGLLGLALTVVVFTIMLAFTAGN